jgi:(p)ppGpp synthase/HD superfamily hydrolase
MAIFSRRVERAIATTLEARRDPARAGGGRVHAITVALILSRYTDDEDTLIAGLLHDALEAAALAPEDIEREFGGKVLEMVRDVTEPALPGLSWDTRKARYLRQLERAPRGSLLVAAADTVATLISMIAAQGTERARPEAPTDRALQFYRHVYGAVRSAWPTCPLLHELRNRLEEAQRKLLPLS